MDLEQTLAAIEQLNAVRSELIQTLQGTLQAIAAMPNVSRDDLLSLAQACRQLGYRTAVRDPNRQSSQGEEDQILRLLLPKDPIFYVDIGAGEPIAENNTWQFYRAGGRGILIEPLPKYYAALVNERPRDACRFVAVSDYTGIGRLNVIGECSSLLVAWVPQQLPQVMVPVEPLSEVMSKFPSFPTYFDLCSIDVEGAERGVLRGIDWERFQPLVFVVEFRDYEPVTGAKGDRTGEWSFLLTDRGYHEVARTKYNVIFVFHRHLPRWHQIRDSVPAHCITYRGPDPWTSTTESSSATETPRCLRRIFRMFTVSPKAKESRWSGSTPTTE